MKTSRAASTALLTALASSFFFTLTYVFNRSMAVDGGHWAWSAALRYLIAVPLLLMVLPFRGGWKQLAGELKRHPGVWFLWSGVGFALFYACLTYAASSGPAWLVASTFQLTIVAGPLLSPFIYSDARRRIPSAALSVGAFIVFGVLLMQLGHFDGALEPAAWKALASVVVAAITYPLGNRMLLLHLEKNAVTLTATQRVTGMTLVSLPFWILLAAFGGYSAGLPPLSQVASSGAVALSAGVIATILFFHATSMVRQDAMGLAAVEATQAGEILFSTLIGFLFLGDGLPGPLSAAGGVVVVGGIVAFSWLSARQRKPTLVLEADAEGV